MNSTNKSDIASTVLLLSRRWVYGIL